MQLENMEGFRLSPQQEHLWLLQQIDQSWAYHSDCAILIEGNLNINNLELALQNIVARYEILRTSFICLPGMTIPVQRITDSKVILDKTHDISNLNPQEQDAKIEVIFQEFNQQIFNFEQGLILHTSLVKISPEKYLLFISLPALCADSVSLNCLLQQLTISYLGNLDEELSEDPLQYADFSEWQNQILEAEETQIGRKYWQQQDLSAVTHPKLPYEKQISENHKFQPKLVNSIIAPELVVNIEALAEKYNTSASIFYLTCWLVLLQKLSRQSEMIVATGVDGRKYEEIKEALGLFAKYLPLHCHLEDNFRFSQILQQLHESVESISKWQECFSWEQILGVDTKSDILPFVPLGFDFAEEHTKHCAGNLSFSIHKLYTCTERFNIKLSCIRKDNFLNAEFHYDSNLFYEHNIADLAEQFHKLLESATNHPEATISELEILSDRHLHKLLVDFNQTQADYPQDKCIHHLFEEQAERTPNNIAVTFSDKKLTYHELNARANQMAHYLQRLGVGKEVLVGICIERSLEMIVGILGILKAGGAYIPLDPNYPSERLAFILEDTKIPVLLTQQRLLEKAPLLKGSHYVAGVPPVVASGVDWGDHLHNAQTICLDTAWEIIAQESQENPSIKTHSENLAYVIYTSGSTGKPKGVQIAHRHLVNSTTARINYYQEPISSFLLLSSFAFDSSVAGLFWTLCSGGILCLPQQELQLDIPKLLELIVENHVSHLLSLPSLYTILLDEAKPEQLTSLCTVIVAGESCPAELVERHHQLPSKPSLFNEYGPTEGTVWSSVYHCQPQQTKGQVSIGQPIANTQIYLLNSHLQPVPVGVIGEVYISGDGLARGYLNQAALTSEKFIPNPFSDRSGMRLYKTGDLARYQSDRNIEFLGRLDQQVKIRGYRIELGEIEAVLDQHPEVREVVVIAQKQELQDMRLVAYLVANQQQITLISELRRYLLDHLPEYMVPSAFVLLKEMPLLPNGKVDRQVLPDQPHLNLEENFVAPENELEQTIAIIWQEVLHAEKVGIHHNFFDLGGHSLLMVQVHSKLYQVLNKELSIVEMFQYPTISAFAKHLSQQLAEKPDLQPSDDLVNTRRESKKQQRQLRQKHQEKSH